MHVSGRMKRRNDIRSLVASLVVALPACGQETTGPRPVNFTLEQRRVATASNAFGIALLGRIPPDAGSPNVLVSPLSVSLALGMTMNGARGATFDAMRNALAFDEIGQQAVNEAYRGLLDGLRARDPRVEFTIANSVWYEQTFDVHAPFLDVVRASFDAHVQPLDFRDPAAPAAINDWVSDRTGGRIEDLIQSIDPLDVMFLVNAMYFRAPWTTPFEPARTHDGPFTRLDGSTVTARMMTNDATFPAVLDDEVQIVELPYGDSTYGMVLAAPAHGTDFDEFLAGVTPAKWNAWTSALVPGRVLLTMPRFRFAWGDLLNDALASLGMGIAFRPLEADFTRIADRDDLYISRVIHKTFIAVDEEGTEAAAATAVGMSVTSLPPEVRFDHPFIFAIRERSTGVILFLGAIADPSSP